MKIKQYRINTNFSGSLAEIKGDHGAIKCIGEDRIYFIVSGEGKFTVDGDIQEVGPEDLIFVPKDTPYDFSGEMKYLLICSPEFNPEDDVWL